MDADRPGKPVLGRAALVLILLLTSFGCQSRGEHSDAPAPQAAAADSAYPDLHSVPPRPQLSYPVLQQREIVSELRADRTNARYTDRVIRYRTGLSSLPPPPEPPPSAPESPAEELVAEAAQPLPPDAAQPEPMEEQAPPRSVSDLDRGGLDDGGLDDMIEDMVIDTEDPSDADSPDDGDLAPAAGPTPDAAPEADRQDPEVGGEPGPVNRLFDWLSGVLGEEEASVASRPAPADSDGRPLVAALPADRRELPGDQQTIAPAAGGAPAQDAFPSEEQAIADPSEPPVMMAAARPAAEASTITVTTSGVELASTALTPDPDPAVIAFAPGSATLPPPAVPKLERFLAEAGPEGGRITVLGEGSPPALAIDRARAVGQALVRLGASADRLRISMATDGTGDRARLVAGTESR